MGSITNTYDISPYGIPFCPDQYSPSGAYQYLYSHMNLREMMQYLNGMILVCDCQQSNDECWAIVLRYVFIDVFTGCSTDDRFAEMVAEKFDVRVQREGPAPRAYNVQAGGLQAARHRIPQLIPDGLSPDQHLSEALSLSHPYLARGASTDAVRLALEWSLMGHNELVARRRAVIEAMHVLADATADEDEYIRSQVHPHIGATLRAYKEKNIAFMREVAFVTSPGFLVQ